MISPAWGKKNYIEQESAYSAGIQILSGPGAGQELQLEKPLLQLATRFAGGGYNAPGSGGYF